MAISTFRATHQTIDAANTVRAVTDEVLLVQALDSTGTVCTTADLAAIKTAVEASATSLAILDDWDETDRAKVNIIAGQAGVAANAGAASALTIRTVTASDSPDVTALQIIDNTVGTDGGAQLTQAIAVGGNDGANFQILKTTASGQLECYLSSDIQIGAVELKDGTTDVRAEINAANTARAVTTPVVCVQTIDAEGDRADWSDLDDTRVATQASATSLAIIDDWDETDRCKVNLIAGQVGVSAGAGASDALTQRVIAATNSPEVTALEIIDDWDETDRCKVNLIAGQAGVAANTGASSALTVRTVSASDSPDVTSLALLDDVVGTDDAAAPTKGIMLGGLAKTAQKAAVTADGDYVETVHNEHGELVLAGHTWATTSTRVEDINPERLAGLDESLLDQTNLAAGTTYYPSGGLDMHGYINGVSLTGFMNDPDGTFTLTVQATNDSDLVTGYWVPNITKSAYMADTNTTNNTSLTVTNGSIDVCLTYEKVPFRYLRFKVVNDGATNEIQLKLRRL